MRGGARMASKLKKGGMKKMRSSKRGEYRLISQCKNTISEQTIYDYYDKNNKIRTTVVEKETKNSERDFVRLIGSTIRHKEGYPPLVFDAGVLKAHKKMLTSFSAFLPTAQEKEHMGIFDSYVQKKLRKKKIAFCLLKETTKIPEYLRMVPENFRRCGFSVLKKGEHLGLIEELKKISFAAYDEVLKLNPSPGPVEEFSDYLINKQSKNEYKVFKSFGMAVPSKVQKAFFTLFSERTEFEQ
jgi:hypothetical protein